MGAPELEHRMYGYHQKLTVNCILYTILLMLSPTQEACLPTHNYIYIYVCVWPPRISFIQVFDRFLTSLMDRMKKTRISDVGKKCY